MLSEYQKKFLRGIGHKLKPTVTIGDRGLTDTVFDEYERTLEHHELIKVRIRVGDRAARNELIGELCERGNAELIQRIGNIALVFRPNPDSPGIMLPRR